MVVAETWSEQKVLMRAYQACEDQSRPAILLHGAPLAMGPAGTDPHGPWGVHVDEPSDGRAQVLREQLELAAQRLAGTEHPARLADEESGFERKATNQWAPGSPRDRHSQQPLPTEAPEPRHASAMPVAAAAGATMGPARPAPRPPQYFAANPDARTIMPFGQPEWLGAPPPPVLPQRRTPRGWDAPAPGASSPGFRRAYTPVPTEDSVSHIVGRTMPIGFSLSDSERAVLNALGRERQLTARAIGKLVAVDDGVAWMDGLMTKLADHGIDIVAPGEDLDGEPTYVLRH
jgi:hypothetical protein